MEAQLKFKEISTDFLVSFITNSISFETLPVSEDVVKRILDNDLDGLDEKLVKTVQNYLNGVLFSFSLVDRTEPFSENDLKDIHEKVVNGLSLGGLYRNVDISIKGSNHTPPSYIKVYDRMKKYFDAINNEDTDKLYKIAFSHLQLMKIHPFLDGNGRVARIVLNYQLMKYGYKLIIISYEEKEKYFQLLEEFKVNKNIEPFINYIVEKIK